MSELYLHPNPREHESVSLVQLGRQAAAGTVEVAKFFINTFSAAGEQRNHQRYGHADYSNRPLERQLHAAHTSEIAQDRRERRADWEYGVLGRLRIAASRSPLASIALGTPVRHPSEVPRYRAKAEKKAGRK